MKIRGIIMTTALILAIIAVSTTTAAALSCSGDICVDPTGWQRDGGSFNVNTTPIQAAVDNANAGETICVAAGSYTENVDIATPHLTLAGEGAGVVTVTAANTGDHVFEVTADYVNISGFTATGAACWPNAGIYLNGADNCNISENNASNNDCGIYLGSSGNTLANNTASNNDCGIWLYDSSNYNTLTSNTASNNYYGICLSASSNNTLTSNTADSNDHYGIYYLYSYYNTLASNTASNNAYGIHMFSSSNNTLTGNTASNNYYGIHLWNSSDNTLTSNTASSNNESGIWLTSSSDNILTDNAADSNNWNGIHLWNSSDNTLVSNTASSNNYYGICLEDSSNDNLIYNNYFNNANNTRDDCNNQWSTAKTSGTNIIGGPFLGGNYWSDYAGVDNDGDGLGDTMLPYDSSGDLWNGGDYHPLVSTVVIPCDGDIYVTESGWWRDGDTFTASGTPIQAAVNAATAGETICVAADSYTENVDIATPHLTLRGEGADVVTVNAASSSDHVFDVTVDYVNISGFTATGTSYPYAGIYLNGADNCNISENNASNNLYGIYLTTSSNNTLVSNTASNNDDGIRLYSSSNYNTLTSNTASLNNDDGIHLSSSSNNTLASNTASLNNGDGIQLRYSSNYNTLTSNTASLNNDDGIQIRSSSNYNTLTSNNASLNNDDGIYLNSSSNYNTLTSNTANSNNDDGIRIRSSSNNSVTCNLVQNNTDYGIYLTGGSTGNNITWNNIVANGELQTDGSYHYQFDNHQSDDVDAISNFWGSGMNNDTIDASIYDDEEGRAEVEFYPFATEPVPCAPAPISEESPAFTTADALIALRIAVGSCPLDLYWDVSGDGQVTSLDALMIVMGTGTG